LRHGSASPLRLASRLGLLPLKIQRRHRDLGMSRTGMVDRLRVVPEGLRRFTPEALKANQALMDLLDKIGRSRVIFGSQGDEHGGRGCEDRRCRRGAGALMTTK
jgi:hypothetical protein